MAAADSRWIYLSPHLDDAILSCGGMIWEQIQMGYSVNIWTIFAGDSPEGKLSPFAESLHARWGLRPEEVVNQRREEDLEACKVLETAHQHFNFPDCIYRRHPDSGQPVIRGEEDLFRPQYSEEITLSEKLSTLLQETLSEKDFVVAPFGIGQHIDHQFLRSAVQGLQQRIWYYKDFPYAAQPSTVLEAWEAGKGESYLLPVSGEGLDHWQRAVGAYTSQISTFWQGLDQMKNALRSYWAFGGGSLLRKICSDESQ